MSRILTNAISAGLIGTGVFAWAFAGRPLVTNPELKAPLNPLGINGSPYGQVFALAMQGPIETYFDNRGGGMSHQHEEGEECDHDNHDAETQGKAENAHHSLDARFQHLLTSLNQASQARTNPRASSKAQELYMRRQVEDKLRFAYQLDPSNYNNYNSLHFFLSEPSLGTRPELSSTAQKLADDTIQYCLKQQNDPRPNLTAAGACTNVLQLMFTDQQSPSPKFNTTQMRSYLNILNQCINRYETEAQVWDQTKNWELLSPAVVQEWTDRYDFVRKIRDASEEAIRIFESKHNTQASN
ncbi:MAG: hypothetical protein ABI600_13655 [Luteolibacter sp.]